MSAITMPPIHKVRRAYGKEPNQRFARAMELSPRATSRSAAESEGDCDVCSWSMPYFRRAGEAYEFRACIANPSWIAHPSRMLGVRLLPIRIRENVPSGRNQIFNDFCGAGANVSAVK